MAGKVQKELTSFIDYYSRIVKSGYSAYKKEIKHLSGDVLVKIRFFSTTPNNESFQISARAALTAELHGKFDEMHELLINHEGIYTKELVIQLAKELELDTIQFEKDLDSEVIKNRLKEDIFLAQQAGATKVPDIAINGHLYKGVWDGEALKERLDNIYIKPVEQAMQSFVNWGASAAIVLLVAALAALLFANEGLIEEYEFLRHFILGFNASDSFFQLPLTVWINDGLMAVFFLLIGLEIKREIVSGELSDVRKATMPVIGAIGGMLLPAILYVVINWNGEGSHGWGVPTATDIAFTLGLMALLGSKVPNALKVFISALAVSDDLGAIIVIALFYGHGFHLWAFMLLLITYLQLLILKVMIQMLAH